MKKLRQHVVDVLCMATGGPCVYIGPRHEDVARRLGITERDWTFGAHSARVRKFTGAGKEREEVWRPSSAQEGHCRKT
jgi:hypothetical protein